MFSRSSQVRQTTALCIWIVIILDAHVSWSQDSTAPFDDGPIQDVAVAMNELARLRIIDRDLELSRDWGSTKVQSDPQDQIDEQIKKLEARGFDGDTAARLAERIVRTASAESPFAKAFFGLTLGRFPGSTQRTSSGNSKTMGFTSSNLKAHGQIRSADNDIEVRLRFRERQEPKRELILEQSDQIFTFQYSGEDFLIELIQKQQEGVLLSRQVGEKQESFKANDFVALRQQNQKLVDGWLLPLMDHLGISVPLLADNNEIVDAVFVKLASYRQRTEEFERLVKQLDSDDYQIRTRANENILANKTQWRGQIEKKLEDERLPLEARVRLQAIISMGESESQIDQMIRDQKLLSSPEYLVGLFDLADENQKKLIVHRLQQVAGLRFSKPTQWKNWWHEKTDQKSSIPDPLKK